MKKILKKTILIVFTLSLFSANYSFAEQTPTFRTLSAVAINENSVHLRGEFNSYDNNYNPTDLPLVWFEYGLNQNSLNKKTREVSKIKGNYIVSQKVSDLDNNTKYYYRSVIKFNDNTIYGQSFSFITNKKQTTVNTETGNVQSPPVNNFLSPDDLLEQYKAGVSGSVTSEPEEESVTFTNGVKKKKDTRSAWKKFWDKIFGRELEEDNYKDSNLVYSEEEIAAINAERDARLEKLTEQENYNDSAANNDEFGEVIEYNTHYQNNYKPTKIKKVSQGNTLNYPVLLFILILLTLAVFLAHLVLRKHKKNAYGNRRDVPYVQNTNTPRPQEQGRYYIPVKRDLHDPKQNPNKAFFRNPSEK